MDTKNVIIPVPTLPLPKQGEDEEINPGPQRKLYHCPRCSVQSPNIQSDRIPCRKCGYPGLKDLEDSGPICRHTGLRVRYDKQVECLVCDARFSWDTLETPDLSGGNSLIRGPDLIPRFSQVCPGPAGFVAAQPDGSQLYKLHPDNAAAQPPLGGYGFKVKPYVSPSGLDAWLPGGSMMHSEWYVFLTSGEE